ncbi:hypothetical protein V6N13_024583 [Hibiscus sabdariffa]
MEQARLDCYSFRINCQCFIFFYASASINCLNRMTKGMSRTETTGPAQAGLLSAETCTPSRLCVLGLRIGSADILGLGLTRSGSNGVWKNMLIISHSLLYFPCLPRPALLSSSLSVVMAWYLLCRLAGCCSGCSGLEQRSLRTIRLAGIFPLRLGVFSCAVGGSAGAGSAAPCYQLLQMDQLVGSVGRWRGLVLCSWWDGDEGGSSWKLKKMKLVKDVRNTFVSSMCWSCRDSILYSWLLNWRMWMGVASSDWTGGGDGSGVGVDPMGEAGVDCLLSCVAGVAAGVGAGLVAWSAGGVAAGLGALPAGATGSGCSEAGGVGIIIWMGTGSAISIFRMYSLRSSQLCLVYTCLLAVLGLRRVGRVQK